MSESQADKQATRLIHFQKSIENFQQTKLPILSEELRAKFKLDEIAVDIFEDAAIFINDYYWKLVNEFIRPIIDSDSKTQDRIDIYKILSCTEYAVISQKPFILTKVIKGEKTLLDYNDDGNKNYRFVENLINGTFAFECALNFIKGWDGDYKRIFNDDKLTSNLFNYIEDIDERLHSMTLADEHVYILSFSDVSNYPVFSNSTWWRSICLNLFLLSETNYEFKKKVN
jgi:hypothetical protein